MPDPHSRIAPPARRWQFLRRFLALTAGLLLLLAAAGGVLFWSLPDVTPLKNRQATITIEVRDWHGQEHPFQLGPQNRYWSPLEDIPAEMKWAVIVAEDATFYQHQGIDLPALREAFKYNLEQKRLARGASTISQQLAKNVFLSREKSLWRKSREFLLALRLEGELSKGRILELYLNVVELGPQVHGVGHGARHFFGKTPAELSPAECALLAAILPGPRVAYNPQLKPEKVRRRGARILLLLHGRKVLDPVQYSRALEELPVLLGLSASITPPALPSEDEDFADEEGEILEKVEDFTFEEALPAIDSERGVQDTTPSVETAPELPPDN
jgi:monofunctional glycosyltransferase